jgi:hypothetical protein
LQGFGTADQFVKLYNDLPRRIGELSQLEAKQARYKREQITRANILAPQLINIIKNGESFYSFDTAKVVMKHIEGYNAINMAGINN